MVNDPWMFVAMFMSFGLLLVVWCCGADTKKKENKIKDLEERLSSYQESAKEMSIERSTLYGNVGLYFQLLQTLGERGLPDRTVVADDSVLIFWKTRKS